MSIIEEALKKIQEKRGEQSRSQGTYIPPLPKLDSGAPGDKDKKRRVRLYAAFGVTMAFIGGGLWLGLDFLQKQQLEAARLAASAPTAPLIPPAPVEQPATPPAQEQAENTPGQMGQAVEDVSAPTPAAPQRTDMFAPPANAPAVAPSVKGQPAPATPAKTSPQAVTAPLPSSTAQTGSFIENGWSAMKGRGFEDGVKVWDAGLRTEMEKDQLVFIVSIYAQAEAAEKKIKEAGEGHFIFVSHGSSAGKPAYYLLAAPPRDRAEEVQAYLMKKLRLQSVKGNPASQVIARLDKPLAPVTDTGLDPPVTAIKSVKPGKKPMGKADKKTGQELASQPRPGMTAEERLAAGRNLVGSGAYVEAVEALQPLFYPPPASWEPYLIMGAAQLGLGKLDAAQSYLDQGLARNGKQPGLLVQRAVVEQQRGNHQAALRLLKDAERAAPKAPEVQLNIGYSSDALGKKEDAAKAYRAFLSVTENSRAYVNVRNGVLTRLGELGY